MTIEEKANIAEMILETLRENFTPEDIFGFDALCDWAKANGFTEPEPEPFTLGPEFDRGPIR